MSATLRPAVIGDASSLALISLEIWSYTYLRHGINAFFADYALDVFTKSRFADVLQDPLEVILVLEKSTAITGYVRLSLNSECGIEGCGVFEIKTLYVRPYNIHRGIGCALLAAALARCEALDYSRL